MKLDNINIFGLVAVLYYSSSYFGICASQQIAGSDDAANVGRDLDLYFLDDEDSKEPQLFVGGQQRITDGHGHRVTKRDVASANSTADALPSAAGVVAHRRHPAFTSVGTSSHAGGNIQRGVGGGGNDERARRRKKNAPESSFVSGATAGLSAKSLMGGSGDSADHGDAETSIRRKRPSSGGSVFGAHSSDDEDFDSDGLDEDDDGDPDDDSGSGDLFPPFVEQHSQPSASGSTGKPRLSLPPLGRDRQSSADSGGRRQSTSAPAVPRRSTTPGAVAGLDGAHEVAGGSSVGGSVNSAVNTPSTDRSTLPKTGGSVSSAFSSTRRSGTRRPVLAASLPEDDEDSDDNEGDDDDHNDDGHDRNGSNLKSVSRGAAGRGHHYKEGADAADDEDDTDDHDHDDDDDDDDDDGDDDYETGSGAVGTGKASSGVFGGVPGKATGHVVSAGSGHKHHTGGGPGDSSGGASGGEGSLLAFDGSSSFSSSAKGGRRPADVASKGSAGNGAFGAGDDEYDDDLEDDDEDDDDEDFDDNEEDDEDDDDDLDDDDYDTRDDLEYGVGGAAVNATRQPSSSSSSSSNVSLAVGLATSAAPSHGASAATSRPALPLSPGGPGGAGNFSKGGESDQGVNLLNNSGDAHGGLDEGDGDIDDDDDEDDEDEEDNEDDEEDDSVGGGGNGVRGAGSRKGDDTAPGRGGPGGPGAGRADHGRGRDQPVGGEARSTVASKTATGESHENDIVHETIDDNLIPHGSSGGEVLLRHKATRRPSTLLGQPGILVAVMGGAVVGLLLAILCVMFVVYRMRKKDEGSYPLGKRNTDDHFSTHRRNYMRPSANREFYA